MSRQRFIWCGGFAIAIWVLVASSTSAQDATLDYPQWRGPNRDGAAAAFVEPEDWPQQLTRRWAVEVGTGYGTPIIIGSRVYTFTRQDGDEVLSAIDTATGRWRGGSVRRTGGLAAAADPTVGCRGRHRLRDSVIIGSRVYTFTRQDGDEVLRSTRPRVVLSGARVMPLRTAQTQGLSGMAPGRSQRRCSTTGNCTRWVSAALSRRSIQVTAPGCGSSLTLRSIPSTRRRCLRWWTAGT